MRGVLRLVLCTLAFAGFVAMHGVAATDPVAGHPGGLAVVADHPVEPATHPSTVVPAEGHETVHPMLAGCLFVLIGLLVAVALRLLGTVAAPAGERATRPTDAGRGARAPPLPIFLTLCVFRL